MPELSKMDSPLDLGGYETGGKSLPFGRWILEQAERGGFIGQLASIAKSDRGFPKDGTPDAVRKRLGDTGADPEMFEAVDDAEMDWVSW
ncbi:hypothetical protein [Novosphingobium guangzhouense]|nr:hypothetical protein [Novosphingobium guangzhouense]